MIIFTELIKNSLSQEDGLIEKKIKLLFSKIAKTNKIDDAELLFENLEDIQFILAKAIFKEKKKVTSFLKNFVYDFDRIDDNEIRENLYYKLKNK